MTYLRNNNIRIGSIFLFCILAIALVNPSVARESPIILNSSHDPAMLRNISHIDSPVGTVTHRYPPGITMGNIPPDRLNNLSRSKNNLINNLSNRTLYLFSWDDIPGNDTHRLIIILKNVFRIEWAESAKIEKIDGGKTILVSTEINTLSLKLNDEKTKVNLTINDNRTDEFIVRMKNSKLYIYDNFISKVPPAGLISKKAQQAGTIRFDIKSLKREHKPGELLVKYTNKLSTNDFRNYYKSQNMTLIKDYPGIGYHLIRVDESRLENTIEGLSLSDKFEDAEPNYIVKALKTPNDLRFNELWAMNNTGQTGGTPDADIDAPEAWNISTGSKEVIVAVIDTGVDYTHEDLAGNMWTNPGEIKGNGIDDDHNGFVDDYYGWDFAYDDNDPMDGDSHGTHVSGTIGGVGNNGKGVAGVSWNTNIMAVKFLDDGGSGWTSDAIDAINYATMMGADIMSNSWGGAEYSSALEAAIQAADDAGILFVAASGNWAEDTDQSLFYPAGYDIPNVMSIAATDKNDNLADFSNYGISTVDIGAPGVDILSSVPVNRYDSYSGTSMAAPHVSGAAALLKAFNPSLTHLEIKDILMKSVDPLPSLYGKTVTGGRLNIQKAITFALTYSTVCQSGCNYRSIQSAIDAANPGNTIIVTSGTYYENVVVNKQLTLSGIGMPVVDARGSGSAITLSADGIILEGFTVTGGASYMEAGIKIISNNNTLRGNNASNNALGMVLESSGNNVMYNNIFNNTENVQFINSNINNWNITKQSRTNIIGGLYLGGNFWAKPDGSGFSQMCDDVNLDGICESAYALDSTNIDYLPFSTKGPIHNINNGSYYTTIQAAINDASPGDEIQVDSGTYFENVNVTRQLNLRGIGKPVVDAGGSGSAITLAADGIILEGFTATGAGSNTGAGINVISNNNTVRANNATSNGLGIFLNSSNFNNITNNNISNSTSVGIKVYDTSKNNTISGNKVTNSNSGMFFVYAFNTTASNNIMENNSFNFGVGGNLTSHFDGNNIETTNLANGRPIYYVKYGRNTIYDGSIKASTFYCILCNNVTVKDLEMSNMDRGVYFWETSNSRIQNITVKQSGWGIFMRYSSNNSIKDSKFSTNNLQDYSETGVSLYSSDNNTFENNTFSSNKYGIELSSSSKNTIYNNYFNNTNNFIFRGITYNTWSITKKPGTNIIGGPYLGGNFWANPSGTGISQTCSDSNIDGLCDLKYSLNTTNVDYLPLKYKSALGITVVSPNGEENWTRGTTHIINWTSTGSPGAYVKIELLKGGVWKSNIISSTPNDGSHPWPILATQAPGSDYKVKITSTTNAAYSGISEDNFTIPVPTITVLSPNGTDIWTRGTTKTIKWNSTGSPGAYVRIELLKPGKPNQLIISSTPNDGLHPWLIPPAQTQGSDYKVKITSTANAAYNDTSDGNFTIPVPSFTVVSPGGGENWTRGAIQTIKWNSTESPGTYVKIELLKPGKPNQLIISSTLNDGSHPWLIPAVQAPGTDYKVKITSTINASNNDTSDNNFTIPIPSFTVVSPNGGENWTRGTTRFINWTSTENPKGYVKIELLKSGILSRTIVTSTLNDGSQTWTIPATQASGTDYKIRISSTINPAYTNSSKSNFSINS